MGGYATSKRLGLPKPPTLRSLLSRPNLEFSQNNPHEGGVLYGGTAGSYTLRQRQLRATARLPIQELDCTRASALSQFQTSQLDYPLCLTASHLFLLFRTRQPAYIVERWLIRVRLSVFYPHIPARKFLWLGLPTLLDGFR